MKVGLAVVVLAVGGGGAFVAMKRPAAVTARVPTAPTEREVAAAPVRRASERSRFRATCVARQPASPSRARRLPETETVDRSPTVGSTRSTTSRRATAAPDSDDIDGQLVLITQAQRALERGEPNAALVALARHEREYPRGSLAPERDGLRAIALVRRKAEQWPYARGALRGGEPELAAGRAHPEVLFVPIGRKPSAELRA